MKHWIIKKMTIRSKNKKYPYLVEGINLHCKGETFNWKLPNLNNKEYDFQMGNNVFFEY